MKKSKRKISQAQRDKTNISIAKKLKEAGIISKQAKLHSGRYISKGVLSKVRQYEAAANLNYKAITVSKDIAKAAKERGYQVVQGNKIIGPNSQTFKKRLKEGVITGVRPVKGGMMEEVSLPHNVMDMQTLVAQLQEGIDTLKMPEEHFAFKYHGNESYRTFMSSRELIEYMMHYRGLFDYNGSLKPEDLQEEFAEFKIFRLHPSTIRQNIPGPTFRKKRAEQKRREAIARGEPVPPRFNRKSWAERMAELTPEQRDYQRKERAKRDKRRRERNKKG